MNPVLEEIINTGNTRTLDGQLKKVIGQITSGEGELIQQCINDIKAEVSIEIGLGFGTSSLYICDALIKTERTKHYTIDPFQMYEASYAGIGLNNLVKAGFENIIEFIDKPSHQALAILEMKNVTADFAFIDGWHTFDHALIDFFLIDKLLRVGGIVILDDADWPAVQKVSSFISSNRSYKFIGGSRQRSYLKKKQKNNSIKALKKYLKYDSSNVKLYGSMAFKKMSNDERPWDHFMEF